jgi:very-short-patch-repair endonuclease
MPKTGREQLEELFPRVAAPADNATLWADLWRNNAPADVRDLPQRYTGNGGGEYQFAREIGRHWRFDWCIVEVKVAVEVDGGNRMARWSDKLHQCVVVGQHTLDEDYTKINTAVALGWRVLRFTPAMLKRDPWGCVQLVAGVVRESDR